VYFLYILFFVHMLNYCSVRFRISNTLESNHVSLILFDIRWLCYFCCGFLNRKQETGNSKHRRANQTVGQMQHVLHFVIGCCYAADGFLLLLPDTADSLSCIVQKFNYNLYFFFACHFSKKRRKLFIDIARECTIPRRPPAQCQVSCYPGLIHVRHHKGRRTQPEPSRNYLQIDY